MKKVTVIISGAPPGQNLRDIEVPSGATAGDILQMLDLDPYWTVSREGSHQHFALEEEIEGHILRVSPQ